MNLINKIDWCLDEINRLKKPENKEEMERVVDYIVKVHSGVTMKQAAKAFSSLFKTAEREF